MRVRTRRFPIAALGVAASLAVCHPAPARAEMVLSQVIVDLQPGTPAHDDIEVWNNGPDRMYVVAEPSEIRSPGLPDEKRLSDPDPAVTGLLVTPQRMVLEPGERRTLRVSAVVPRAAADRIYRVVVRPVAGPVSASATAIKVLIGYDVLVLFRPDRVAGDLTATRSGRSLSIHNGTNTAQELFDGTQCDPAGRNCQKLGATRLYAGATWQQELPYDTPVDYHVTAGRGTTNKRF
ncbi:hypothetical protein F9288_09090 [Sphingomonas sp. CL5.1]|uniref:fimbrial biogenesis chaperone n=1 Tax=Sphingomonas sp. CL5.1 TaxID=2653203 RepID=UPI00158418E8|nr:hypothetical protein [Sphingomonas sp. CL5.1]QKR99774.1 hypothetical protein F9288_09090 [Sphingomonas sp. CL5.1]